MIRFLRRLWFYRWLGRLNRAGIHEASYVVGWDAATRNPAFDQRMVTWQHDETGRIAELPEGDSPGPCWAKIP